MRMRALLLPVVLFSTCGAFVMIGRARSGFVPGGKDDALPRPQANVQRLRLQAAARKECERAPGVPAASALDDAMAKHDREVMLKRCIARRVP